GASRRATSGLAICSGPTRSWAVPATSSAPSTGAGCRSGPTPPSQATAPTSPACGGRWPDDQEPDRRSADRRSPAGHARRGRQPEEATPMTAQIPPGWHDDPDGSPNAERRWDGHAWTPERRRKTTHTPPPAYAQPPQ